MWIRKNKTNQKQLMTALEAILMQKDTIHGSTEISHRDSINYTWYLCLFIKPNY